MLKDNEIYFNIWDDYSDDGHVRPGENQDTDGRLENSRKLGALETPILHFIFNYIDSLKMEGVKAEVGGDQITFFNLKHSVREDLVSRLQGSGLKYNDMPIHFYSES